MYNYTYISREMLEWRRRRKRREGKNKDINMKRFIAQWENWLSYLGPLFLLLTYYLVKRRKSNDQPRRSCWLPHLRSWPRV